MLCAGLAGLQDCCGYEVICGRGGPAGQPGPREAEELGFCSRSCVVSAHCHLLLQNMLSSADQNKLGQDTYGAVLRFRCTLSPQSSYDAGLILVMVL
jgi:hypothetical protein